MKTNARTLLAYSVATTVLGALAACGGNSPSTQGSAATPSTPSLTAAPSSPGSSPTSSAAPWNPTIKPGDFSTVIDHPYYPLKPGSTKVFDGLRDGQPMHTEFTVTHRTRTVMGVECVVVEDVVTSNGALVEKTEDWFAQKKDGSVWYFGENTAEYTNGAVSSTHGTWEAGVDGAVPGVIMHAHPKVGTEYYQEYRPGEAEDRAKILSLDSTIKVPAGSYTHVITTEDSDPLNPDKTDEKWYAEGVGVVHSVRIKTDKTHETMSLVSVTGP
jgi:hypothetical protein